MKMTRVTKNSNYSIRSTIIYSLLGLLFFFLGSSVYAQSSGETIGTIATNVTGTLSSLARLVTAGSYLAGMAFAVAAILKFKAHKDNPTQIPVSTGVVLLFVAAALIFLPTIFSTAGGTLFGSSGKQATISGVTSF